MPVYHSSFNNVQAQTVCGASVLPIKTAFKGPANPCPADQMDIIDEAIDFFRANVLFRQYDPQGPADRVLCYLTIYISECLRTLAKYSKDKTEAKKQMTMFGLNTNFPAPGEGNFGLGGFFTAPKARTDTDLFRAYFAQLRQETAKRMLEKVFEGDSPAANKYWIAFSKKKFMNITSA
jgi:actin related protein 2/3 complex subunit 3